MIGGSLARVSISMTDILEVTNKHEKNGCSGEEDIVKMELYAIGTSPPKN